MLEKILLWRRFISTLAYFSLQSVFFIYLNDKGFSQEAIAGAMSFSVFFSQALAVFSGVWGDRYGYMRMVFLGTLCDVLAYALLMNAERDWAIMVASAIFGIGSSLFSTNARAALLAAAGTEYQHKAKSQGKFLRVTSMASMFAPLLAVPFIEKNEVEVLIWVCFAISVTLCVMMLRFVTKCGAKIESQPFQFSQIKRIFEKHFLITHFALFFPLGLASSFFILFPYLFNNLLNMPEQVPYALFVNGLITVLVQATFSKYLDVNSRQVVASSLLVILLLILTWFVVLSHLSFWSAYVYLVIFTLAQVFSKTIMANQLIKLERSQNPGFIVGASRLSLSLLSFAVMNLVPFIFFIRI